jgi:iron complex outermembrane recepter protein
VGLLLWLWATIAAAAAGQRFDIPAGPASTGLNLFARQAGAPLLYLNDDVRAKRTNEVRGVYSTREALDLLLKDTGISAVVHPNGVLTLSVARDEPSSRAPPEEVRASEASRSSPSVSDAAPLDEVVIVTAQFREESLHSTPLAITAVSGAELEQRNLLTDVTAISQAAPNVTLVQSGSNGGKTTRAYIRGVGEGDYNFALEPGVAFYIDDVYLGTAYGTLLELMDLERVEVLRGPQGTLFGKNAIGGAVRLISRQPKGDDSGYLEATTGSFNRFDLRGAYDLTLVPNSLFVRVTAMSKKRDGYVDLVDFACAHPDEVGSHSAPYSINPREPGSHCKYDELANDDVGAARVALRWLPGDSVEWNFSGDYSDDRGKGAADTLLQVVPGVFTSYNNSVSIPQYGIPYDSRFVPSNRFQSYATFENAPYHWEFGNSNRLETWGLQNRINWTIDDALAFTSITAYRQYAGAFSRDSDSSPMSTDSTSETMKHDQFSQELRLRGTLLDSRLDWTLGAFLFDGESRDAGLVTADLFDLRFHIDDPSGVHNRSGFLHSVYHFTSHLNLTAGLRYTTETKDYTFNRLDVPQPAPTPFFGPDGMHIRTSQHYNKTDWRLGLDYEWTDEVMTYLQASTGFRGAGFNPRPALPSQIIPFGTETLTSYEIGVKSELLDRRLRVNAAAFFSKYDDIQLTARIPDLAGFPANVRVNAGEAGIRGFELELSARLSERLSIDGQAAWTYFRYTDLGLAAGLPGGPTLDTDPVYTPRVRYNLWAHYSVPLAHAGALKLDGGYVWQDRLFTDAANTPVLEVGSYGLLSARLTWSTPDERWSVVAFGTNLTDASYYYGKMFISGNGQVKGIPGRPREWGLTLRRTF